MYECEPALGQFDSVAVSYAAQGHEWSRSIEYSQYDRFSNVGSGSAALQICFGKMYIVSVSTSWLQYLWALIVYRVDIDEERNNLIMFFTVLIERVEIVQSNMLLLTV